jgi:hypothetical protein
MTDQLATAVSFRVDSEVGRLRKVIVHRPGLEHTRLTPTNAEELLFDDVIWVKRAKEEHDAFVSVMRDHDVEVFDAHGSGSSTRCSTSATWACTSRGAGATGPRASGLARLPTSWSAG